MTFNFAGQVSPIKCNEVHWLMFTLTVSGKEFIVMKRSNSFSKMHKSVCVLLAFFATVCFGDILSSDELIASMRQLQLPAGDAEDFYSAHSHTHLRFRSPRSVKFEDDGAKSVKANGFGTAKSAEALSASFGVGPQGLTGSISAAASDGENTKGFFGAYPGVAGYPHGGYYGHPHLGGGGYHGYPHQGGFNSGSSAAAAASSSGGGPSFPILNGGLGGPVSHGGGSAAAASASASGSGLGGGYYPGGGYYGGGGGYPGLGYPGGYHDPALLYGGYRPGGAYNYPPVGLGVGGFYGGPGYGPAGFGPGYGPGFGYGGFRKGDDAKNSGTGSGNPQQQSGDRDNYLNKNGAAPNRFPSPAVSQSSKPSTGSVIFKEN